MRRPICAADLLDSNELWKKQRKYMNQLTSPTAAATYEPLQDLESCHLVRDLLEAPADYWQHATRYAGSTIMGVTFNKRAVTAQSPDITEVRRAAAQSPR
jgi:cytochrome P450